MNVGIGNEATQFHFLGKHKSDFRCTVQYGTCGEFHLAQVKLQGRINGGDDWLLDSGRGIGPFGDSGGSDGA